MDNRNNNPGQNDQNMPHTEGQQNNMASEGQTTPSNNSRGMSPTMDNVENRKRSSEKDQQNASTEKKEESERNSSI